MPLEEFVKIGITTPPPEEGAINTTYRIEGNVKAFDALGAPPWVYAQIQKKEWYKPEIIEETSYARGLPMPISGKFTIDWRPTKKGVYEVTVIATPAPLSLPMIGVQPVVGKSDLMPITISEEVAGEYKDFKITSYDSVAPLNVLEVNIGDTIRVVSEFDYIGPATTAKLYSALWHSSPLNPHDEIAHGEREIAILDSPPPGNHIKGEVDIIVPAGFAGTDFGLYTKIASVTGPDIFTDYYENIVTIIGAEFKDVRITTYDSVTPPNVLQVKPGDTIKVTTEFDYLGPAVSGKLYTALWNWTAIDPHNEIAHGEKSFSIPDSPAPGEHLKGEVNIVIPEGYSAGLHYGLYTKITGVPGEPRTDYYEKIIEIAITEADIADFDFLLTKGTYDIGAKVPFAASYKYKGIKQAGQLVISIGTGVYPLFSPVFTYAPKSMEFEEAVDWEALSFSGSITLPDTLEPGQTYSVRATLETLTAKVQETDTDWSVFDITKLPPTDIADFEFSVDRGTYDLGDDVSWDLLYKYKGKAQSGWLTISLGTGIYPSFSTKHTFSRVSVELNEAVDWDQRHWSGKFTLPTILEPGQTYSVRLKLETGDGIQEIGTEYGAVAIAKAIEMETLEVAIDPAGAGSVTTSPEPSGGTENNWLFPYGTIVIVTAHPMPGYTFDWWSGEMKDTPDITAPVYPMTEHRGITAHFKKVEGYSLTVGAYPSYAGTVTKDPDKALYAPGERVEVTGHAKTGYTAEAWYLDGVYWAWTYGTEPLIYYTLINKSHTLTLYFREI